MFDIFNIVSVVPLHILASIFKFFKSIIGAPIFSSSVCKGRPLIVREFKNSVG